MYPILQYVNKYKTKDNLRPSAAWKVSKESVISRDINDVHKDVVSARWKVRCKICQVEKR